MVPPAWEEESEDSPWTEEYDDEFGEDEEFAEEDEAYLDDDVEDEESGEEEDEDELEAIIDEGEALIEEGEYTQALELYREAAERFPESPKAVCKLGDTALMLFGDGIEETPNWQDDDDLSSYYEEALNAFDMAIQIDPDYYPAYNSQGALYMLVDNVEAAIESWEKSLDLNPDQDVIASALDAARNQ